MGLSPLMWYRALGADSSFCRCISAVIAASEFIRSEKSELQRQSLPNGHGSEMEPETLTRTSVQANIKSTMQLYVKYSAGIILSSFSESNRYCSRQMKSDCIYPLQLR